MMSSRPPVPERRASSPRSASRAHRFIVVGVAPGQPAAVAARASEFAREFGAELVCACVDASKYTVAEGPDGAVQAANIDPDAPDVALLDVDPELRDSLAAVLEPRGVPWSVRALAGGPAAELSRLAETLDAAMIVVGTRERGLREEVREFLGGSVAVQLAHRQHRPVVVVPLAPVMGDGALPWQQGGSDE